MLEHELSANLRRETIDGIYMITSDSFYVHRAVLESQYPPSDWSLEDLKEYRDITRVGLLDRRRADVINHEHKRSRLLDANYANSEIAETFKLLRLEASIYFLEHPEKRSMQLRDLLDNPAHFDN